MSVDLTKARWRKATASGMNGGCIEVADLGHVVAVRDSKDPGGPRLLFTPYEWDCFLDGAVNGEFSQPS